MLIKLAQPKSVAAMQGRLVHSPSGWVLLEVPNALVRGVFNSLAVPGIELPLGNDGRLNAHISVMRPADLIAAGGKSKITELGQMFKFQVGPLQEVKPKGWADYEKVWFLSVQSPELMTLRKSYGLPPLPVSGRTEMRFHITVARRKKAVLRPNQQSKA